jgi:hypothetical protein
MFVFSTSSNCGFVITVVLKAKRAFSLYSDDDGNDGVKHNTKDYLNKKKFILSKIYYHEQYQQPT